jgi:hypothetical protein
MRIGVVLMPIRIWIWIDSSRNSDPDRHQYDADAQHWTKERKYPN